MTLRKTLCNLIDDSANSGKPMSIRLARGLRVSVNVVDGTTHLLLGRDTEWPSDTEYKTVLDNLPFPPSPWPWPPQRLKRAGRLCLYGKWPTIKRMIGVLVFGLLLNLDPILDAADLLT